MVDPNALREAVKRQPRQKDGKFGHKARADIVKPHAEMRLDPDASRRAAAERHRDRGILHLRERLRQIDNDHGLKWKRRWWQRRRRVAPAAEIDAICAAASAKGICSRGPDGVLQPDRAGRRSPSESAARAIFMFRDGAPGADPEHAADRAAARSAAASVVLGHKPLLGRPARTADIAEAIRDIRWLPAQPVLPPRGDDTQPRERYLAECERAAEMQWMQAVSAADATVKEIAALHPSGTSAHHDGVYMYWTSPDGIQERELAPVDYSNNIDASGFKTPSGDVVWNHSTGSSGDPGEYDARSVYEREMSESDDGYRPPPNPTADGESSALAGARRDSHILHTRITAAVKLNR